MERIEEPSRRSHAAYAYQSSGSPHALCGVSDVATDWGLERQDIAYTDFGKVKSIDEGSHSCRIGYLPDGQRGYMTLSDGRTSTTRFYGDSYELFRDTLGNTSYIYYLSHGAILHRRGTTRTVLQGYYDAQGSLIALVDADGNVVRRYAYDPWGRRMKPTDWMEEDTSDPDATYHITRGYTMHEHLDDFGLINMNGRMFDPAVAQFLSPDNYIQSEGNWLNFNRYAYCLNNPVNYTDPSGEIVWEAVVMGSLVGGFANVWENRKNCQGFGEYATSFIVGALSGAAAVMGNMAAVVISSAIASGANNCLAQTDHFKGEVDWLGVGLSSIVGAGTGLAGSTLGKYGGRCGEKLENWALQKYGLSTKTQYIGRIIIGGVTGGITSGIIGFSFGFGESLLFSDSPREAFEKGWSSCKSSFIQGAIIGAITGCAEEYEQNRNTSKTSVENQNMEIPPINQCPEPNVPSLDLRPDYSSPQIPNSENLMNPLLFKYLDAKIKAGR